MKITRDSHPALVNAFEEVALPGKASSAERTACINIPHDYACLAEGAERGLARMKATSEQDWCDFLHGDAIAAAAIRERRGDLDEAEILLWKFHTGWAASDEPPGEDVS